LNTGSLPHPLAQVAQSFTLAVFESSEHQKLAEQALHATDTWNQRACKLAAPLVFWFSVELMLFREDSVQTVLERLLRILRERHSRISPRDVTPEAACKARYRLGHAPLRFAFEESASHIDPPPTFRGLRPYAIDGTKMDMPDTPANEEFFGRPKASRGHSAFPQLAVVTLVDTYSHRVRGFEHGPCDSPERPSGLTLLRSLGAGDVAIVDRGYPSRRFCLDASSCEANFLVRIPKTWSLDVRRICDDGSALIDLHVRVPLPEEEQVRWRKTTDVTVPLRLVEYQVDGGETIRLLTDLLDPESYPALAVAELYHERWEAEVNNAETKVTLAAVKHGRLATTFRSKRPEGVLQELYALFLGYNLVREMMGDAAELADVRPRELSLTRSIHIIREALPRFDQATDEELPYRYSQLLEDLSHALIDRPRRPRSNPRVVKQKMSNFGVKKLGMRGTDRGFRVRVVSSGPTDTS